MDRLLLRRLRNVTRRARAALAGSTTVPAGVTIGRHTYGYGAQTFQTFMATARIEVGGFCSISRESRILAGSEHVTARASTFPFEAQLFNPTGGNAAEAIDKGTTIIGNDVWIGVGAIVLSGVLVGDGAVIGAGAVVSKSVPPYAVVAGNPARIVRYRFEADVRHRLLALRWWDWDDTELRAQRRWFTQDVGVFLSAMEKIHPHKSEGDLARRLHEISPRELTPAQPGATPQ